MCNCVYDILLMLLLDGYLPLLDISYCHELMICKRGEDTHELVEESILQTAHEAMLIVELEEDKRNHCFNFEEISTVLSTENKLIKHRADIAEVDLKASVELGTVDLKVYEFLTEGLAFVLL